MNESNSLYVDDRKLGPPRQITQKEYIAAERAELKRRIESGETTGVYLRYLELRIEMLDLFAGMGGVADTPESMMATPTMHGLAMNGLMSDPAMTETGGYGVQLNGGLLTAGNLNIRNPRVPPQSPLICSQSGAEKILLGVRENNLGMDLQVGITPVTVGICFAHLYMPECAGLLVESLQLPTLIDLLDQTLQVWQIKEAFNADPLRHLRGVQQKLAQDRLGKVVPVYIGKIENPELYLMRIQEELRQRKEGEATG